MINVYSQIEASASICFGFFELQLLFEHGLYSRAAFIPFSVITVHSCMGVTSIHTFSGGGGVSEVCGQQK